MKKLTTEEFIVKAKTVHGETFGYENVEYKTSYDKVKIICKTHGEFEQKANSHLNGHGCPKCHNLKVTNDKFIEKAKLIHGDLYNYSLVEYKHSKKIICISCEEHGVFEQTPNAHLRGDGCPKCGGTMKLTNNEFIDKSNVIHNNLYDYSLTKYETSKIKVKIICPIHGVFEQQPDSHLQGIGCPTCSLSKGELLVNNFLISNRVFFKPQHKFPECKHKRVLPFDFYLPNYNTCVEFDGKQHYKPIKHFGGDEVFEEQKIKDRIKSDYCSKNGIKLIRIQEKNKINEILKKELNL